MITIKTLWLYSALLASLLAGVGAGYVALPDASELENQLKIAREEMDQLQKKCNPETGNTYQHAPVIHSPSRGF